jgi:hypothetical protein
MAQTKTDSGGRSSLLPRRCCRGACASALIAGAVLAAPALAGAQPPPPEASNPSNPPPPAIPPAPVPPPPALPAFDPKVAVGGWLRVGGRAQNPSTYNEINDFFMDQLYVIAALRGQITRWLRWQINLNANHYTPPGDQATDAELVYATAGVQDLIVRIEPHDLFNVWVGRMLVPLDRANISGPWFINYWLFRGVFPGRLGNTPPPLGIKSGLFGRDEGVMVWGQVGGGKFKYFVAALDLDGQNSVNKPNFVGRLCLNLLDPEPGYYHQSAYHGEKDILAIGAGVQYQKNGSVTIVPVTNPATQTGDLLIFEVDALLDKKLGSAGVLTAEVDAYFMDKVQPVNRLFVFNLGYVSPPMGPGRLGPAVRYQFTMVPADREVGLDQNYRQIDGYVQYLIKSHFAKIMVGGFYTTMRTALGPTGGAKGIQIGIQLIHL